MRISRLFSKLNNRHFFSLAGNVVMSAFTILSMAMLYSFLPDRVAVGNWVFFQTMFSLVDMFRTGFLTTATIKFYAGADKNRAMEVVGSTWVLGSFITLGLLLLNIPALLLVKIVHVDGLHFFLQWFGISYLLTMPTFVANCVLQAEGRFDRLFYMRAVTQVSFVLSLFIFILLHRLTLGTVIFSYLLSLGLTSLFVLAKGWTYVSSWRKRSKQAFMDLYNYGKYSVMGNISSYLLRASDIIVIALMFKGDEGTALVAVYNLGLKLMEIIEIPLRSFVATAMPALSAFYTQNRKEELIYTMKKYAGMLTLALIPICLGGVLLADVAVYIVGHKNMVGTEAANILRLFLTFALLFPADRFLAVGLDAIHKPNINFYKIVIMLIVNVAGDFAGIAIFGNIYGLAITTIFPTIIGVVVGYWYLRKYQPFRLRDIYVVGFREARLLVQNTLKTANVRRQA